MAQAEKTSPAKTNRARGGRVRKLTKKETKTKLKSETKSRQPVSGSFRLTGMVIGLMRSYWKTLGGIVFVYLVLNIVFASGISSLSGSIDAIKANLNATSGHAHPLAAAASGFLTLVGSAGASSSSTGSTLQMVVIVLESLVIIWALRHLVAGQKITVKQAYYNSMTPLVPFLIVVFVIMLQFLPLGLGSLILSAMATSIGTISGMWTVMFGFVFLLLAAWSVYMLSASIFALYIITLPEMQPLAALRSAKKLVKYRRGMVLRKVLFLPILMLIVMGAVIIPLILYATFLVVPVFYVLSMLAILFVHAYLYSLYRGLLA